MRTRTDDGGSVTTAKLFLVVEDARTTAADLAENNLGLKTTALLQLKFKPAFLTFDRSRISHG
jgi:hypothetical protein